MFQTKKRIREIQLKLSNRVYREKGDSVKELKIELELLYIKLTEMRLAYIESN